MGCAGGLPLHNSRDVARGTPPSVCHQCLLDSRVGSKLPIRPSMLTTVSFQLFWICDGDMTSKPQLASFPITTGHLDQDPNHALEQRRQG